MFLPSKEIVEFFPEYRSTQIAWQGLTPIAAWAMTDLKPRRVVELGSYRGDSFFSFLQAAQGVEELVDLVAVDTWEGDQHTGAFVEDVHAQFHTELSNRNDARARSIRAFFVDAASEFKDQSIDLIHIDGAHDYASVREDFETWLPKMTDDGVMLFHDTVVKKEDFGVWKFWEELEQEYPGRCFNFSHSNGLGILCLGSSNTGELRKLCKLPPVDAAILRDVMRMAGERVSNSTKFEAKLMQRNGGEIRGEHVFSRGTERSILETARRVESNFSMDKVDDRIERLINEQVGDLFAVLKPILEEHTTGIVNARIEALVSEQAGDLFAALKPQLEEHATGIANARIEALVSEQTSDLFAALKPILEEHTTGIVNARIEAPIKERPGFASGLERLFKGKTR